jgi:hypothetical protein
MNLENSTISMQASISEFLLRIFEDGKLHIVINLRLIISSSVLLQAAHRASEASSGVHTT